VLALTVALAVPLVAARAGAQEELAAALKESRAEAILVREEAQGRPFDPAFRAQEKARLVAASPEELEAVEKRGHGLLPSLAPLDNAHDLTYTPVTPCRIIDTRLVGGPIAAGTQRSFYVAGSFGFDTQGGHAGGCGVPFGPATAVVINYVAVQAAGPGDLRAWPYAGTVPTASVINYAQVPGLNIANGLVQPLCAGGGGTCLRDITVQADASDTQLVADVVGYFAQFPKTSVRSFTESVLSPAGGGDLTGGGSCTNSGGTQITVTAPVAGRIVVRGSASLRILHVTGTTDDIWTAIGSTPTECPPTDFGRSLIVTRIPAALPTFNGASGNHLMVQVQPTRAFDVAAGTYTFYLNFVQLNGGGDDDATYRSLEATFHPN
jgi:hypothetical protein